MNTYKTTIFGSIIILLISTWGVVETSFSLTAFIPLVIAVLLLLCAKGVKEENKLIAHIAVLLALLCFLGLFMALKGTLERDSDIATYRVLAMIITSGIILASYINSFIQARRKRE